MDESMAHGIGKVGEDNHHVFICILYLFVFALEVVQLILNGVFLDQGTTFFNFHLCLIDSIHGFNEHFGVLVCGLNHRGKTFVHLHLTPMFLGAVIVVWCCACVGKGIIDVI